MATLAARGSGTPTTTGTTWAALTNAVDGAAGTNPATYATMTNATSGAVATIEVTGYNFSATIAATATLNSVTVAVRHLENNTGRFATVRFQPYDGATAIGTIFTATLATAARTDSTTFPVTLAQIRSATFKIRVTITGAASTQSRVFSLDQIDVTADYTPLTPKTGTATAAHTYAVTASGVAPVVLPTGARTLESDVQRTTEDAVGRSLESVPGAPNQGSATVSYDEAPSASGKRTPKATATANWAETATAAGKRAPRGAATTTYSETLNASGKRTPNGATTTAHAWTSTAAGKKVLRGTGTLAFIETPNAVGHRAPKATATTVHTWTANATGASTVTWTPDQLAGLGIWLDASQLGLVDGAAVNTWPDLSGNNRHLTAKSTGRPVLKTNALNGLSVVYFDGALQDTNRALEHYSQQLIFRHVFMLARFRLATFNNWNGLLSGQGGNDLIFIGHAGQPYWYNHWGGDTIYHLDGVLTPPDLTAPMNNVWRHFNISRISDTWTFWMTQIGQDRDEPRYWDGDVAEVIVYDRVLSTTERQQVEQYIEQKWMGAAPPDGTGSATVTHTWASTAAGRRSPRGTATTNYSETSVVSGKRTPKASATTNYLETPTAAGKKTPKATSTVAHTWTQIAQGVKPVVGVKQGSGLVYHAWTSTAAGRRAPKGSRTIAVTWTPTATGKKVLRGTAVTAHLWQSNAVGKKTQRATAVAVHVWTPTAVGGAPTRYITGLWNGKEVIGMQWGSEEVEQFTLT